MNQEERKFSRWRPHPWHGLRAGPSPPEVVDVYVEITPFDLIKYEIDKETGYLRVDRPQRGASLPPTVYGFIPHSYCGRRVGDLSSVEMGDHDPLDVCVLMERPVERSEVILTARVLGGIRMVDDGMADDKIVTVLEQDALWGAFTDISDIPQVLIDRLTHYFLTYKGIPPNPSHVRLEEVIDRKAACRVVSASLEDYIERFKHAAERADEREPTD